MRFHALRELLKAAGIEYPVTILSEGKVQWAICTHVLPEKKEAPVLTGASGGYLVAGTGLEPVTFGL